MSLQLGPNDQGEERLRKVHRDNDPWDELEIPPGHKDIVQSLVKAHFTKDKSRKMDFDLIRDKGEQAHAFRMIISILMSGQGKE